MSLESKHGQRISVLQILHTHHGQTTLGTIRFHLSLSWAEPDPLLSHDYAHAWRGSREQTCSCIVLVNLIHKPCIGFSSSSGFFVPCFSVSVLFFSFCFDLRTWATCFLWHTRECRPWQTVTTFGSSRLTYDSRAYRDISSLVLPFLFA